MTRAVQSPSDGRDASGLDTEFTRGLGLYDATMVVVGSMIGSGIFIVSADMARLIGSPGWLLGAWLLWRRPDEPATPTRHHTPGTRAPASCREPPSGSTSTTSSPGRTAGAAPP